MDLFAPLTDVSFDQVQNASLWWDEVWNATFIGASQSESTITLTYFVSVARIILLFVFPFWTFALANACGLLGGFGGIQERLPDLLRMFIASFVVFVLIGNNGALVGRMAFEARDLIHGIRDQSYEIQIINATLGDAVQDARLTMYAGDAIRTEIQRCESLPHPPVAIPSINPEPGTELTQKQQQLVSYFQCYQSLQTQVKQAQDDLPNYCQGGACKAMGGMISRILNSITQSIDTETAKILDGELPNAFSPFAALGDLLAGSVAIATFKPILVFSQWLFISVLELSLWLAAVVAPLSVAFALIPGQFNVFAAWALGFFSIGLTQILYTVLIGVSALLLQKTSTANITEVGFPILLAIGAPYASAKLIFAGATAVANGYSQKATGSAGAAISLGAAAISGGSSLAASAASQSAQSKKSDES